ncbi:MAG TPA: iron-sulfur cluster assembly accessory protein, partial [Nitrospirae bacterium]|nr:iron-sulfur cluster assembly accessory protein [Nitrospirota bacterium]
MLDITAAAIKQFKEVLTESGETNHGIRVFVSGDGCCSSYGL